MVKHALVGCLLTNRDVIKSIMREVEQMLIFRFSQVPIGVKEWNFLQKKKSEKANFAYIDLKRFNIMIQWKLILYNEWSLFINPYIWFLDKCKLAIKMYLDKLTIYYCVLSWLGWVVIRFAILCSSLIQTCLQRLTFNVYLCQQLNIFSTSSRINPKPTEPLTTMVVARLNDREVLRNFSVAYKIGLLRCLLY